jgi:hypothetical protein
MRLESEGKGMTRKEINSLVKVYKHVAEFKYSVNKVTQLPDEESIVELKAALLGALLRVVDAHADRFAGRPIVTFEQFASMCSCL